MNEHPPRKICVTMTLGTNPPGMSYAETLEADAARLAHNPVLARAILRAAKRHREQSAKETQSTQKQSSYDHTNR